MSHTVEIDLNGSKVSLETGKIAKQAGGSVVVRSGDSVVLVTATSAEAEARSEFFSAHGGLPRVHIRGGKFPGGFIKREGRPSEKEILTGRLIDRPIRPLFPEGYQPRDPDHCDGPLGRP